MLCGYEVTRCLHASDRTRWLHMDCEHWTGTGEDRILALDDGGGSVFPVDAFRPWLPPMMGRRVRVREVSE